MKCQQTSTACKPACRPHLLAYNFPLRPSFVRQRCSSSIGSQLCSSRRIPSSCCGLPAASSRTPCSSIVCSASINQQAVPTATASTTAAAAAASAGAAQQRVLPFAALSRVLLNANNSTVFRSALTKRQPVSGPMGLLLFLLTLIAASIAAIRGALVKKGKSCKSCRGFGLQRCRLCLGSGRVDWAAKLKHFDVCPLCMNKRFIICTECGGHYHRPMFSHLRRQAGGAFEPSSEPSFEGPIVLNLAMAGAAAGGAAGSGGKSQILSSMSD